MEEDHYNPSEINSLFHGKMDLSRGILLAAPSVDLNNILKPTFVYINKKRKLQAEQLGLPMPKHNCWDRSFSSELGSPSNLIPETKGFCKLLIKGRSHGGPNDDESETKSANGSNSFDGDADSIMSLSGEGKTHSQFWNTCFKSSLYSLDSRPVTKSSADKDKSTFIDEEHNSFHHNIGLPTSLSYEQLIEFASNVDYSCSQYGDDSIEQCIDKDRQDFLYSSGGNPNNYVLSSGRWNVNQETQPGTEKLTIDKEFEQYFSTFLL